MSAYIDCRAVGRARNRGHVTAGMPHESGSCSGLDDGCRVAGCKTRQKQDVPTYIHAFGS
eukprot:1427931-Ditylum_brightwellii.AAC.1